ncbi:tryptophan 2,3-dioxygenase [Plantactinospora siamensis]|uniref:Tryptophan 2,3-dioxygenase n=1 Tax=Plantactinospora siamensis TaxID=555372 RepID=A0ABV6NY25_9ACTN
MESTDVRAPAPVRPVSAADRAARAAANRGGPTLEFADQVPYDAYVRASTLHGLQHRITGEPGEMSFLMVSQIMELYFKLICFELREASRLIRADDPWGALAPLRRAALELAGLNGAWAALRWMTPADFNRFRDELGEASGFQSAMYRQLEFLLGLRNPALIRPFHRQTNVYDELVVTLAAPSIWDDVLELLHRRGFDVPAEVLRRDYSDEHEPAPAVEAAWIKIYADGGPDNHLRMLGEALAEVAEQFGDWRYQHVKAVQRSMGAKVGSGGSNGLAWLQRSMARVVFPELWSARTAM